MVTKIHTAQKRVQETKKSMNHDEETKRFEKPYINSTPIPATQYDVFLDTEIGDPADYRELNYLLNTATENDRFNLYINSPGGNLNTALMIIESLKMTEASTMAILQGECHSAASMITMYCQEVAVLDSAHSLIHTASYGTVGNTGNVKAHTEFTTRQVEKLLDETYEGFLTPEELEKVKIGVEFWFDSEEISARLKKRAELLISKMETEQQSEENGEEK